jgi:hypothetical protein
MILKELKEIKAIQEKTFHLLNQYSNDYLKEVEQEHNMNE